MYSSLNLIPSQNWKDHFGVFQICEKIIYCGPQNCMEYSIFNPISGKYETSPWFGRPRMETGCRLPHPIPPNQNVAKSITFFPKIGNLAPNEWPQI